MYFFSFLFLWHNRFVSHTGTWFLSLILVRKILVCYLANRGTKLGWDIVWFFPYSYLRYVGFNIWTSWIQFFFFKFNSIFFCKYNWLVNHIEANSIFCSEICRLKWKKIKPEGMFGSKMSFVFCVFSMRFKSRGRKKEVKYWFLQKASKEGMS